MNSPLIHVAAIVAPPPPSRGFVVKRTATIFVLSSFFLSGQPPLVDFPQKNNFFFLFPNWSNPYSGVPGRLQIYRGSYKGTPGVHLAWELYRSWPVPQHLPTKIIAFFAVFWIRFILIWIRIRILLWIRPKIEKEPSFCFYFFLLKIYFSKKLSVLLFILVNIYVRWK